LRLEKIIVNHVLPRYWPLEGHTKFKRWGLAVVFGPEKNPEKQDRGTALRTSLTVYSPEKNPRNTEGHSTSNISE
jgi:hypothetical protein